MMRAWKEFLDSLATRGGTILILLVLCVLGAALVLHVMHHDPGNKELLIFATGFAGGFTSALTLALTAGTRLANGKSQPPPQT